VLKISSINLKKFEEKFLKCSPVIFCSLLIYKLTPSIAQQNCAPPLHHVHNLASMGLKFGLFAFEKSCLQIT